VAVPGAETVSSVRGTGLVRFSVSSTGTILFTSGTELFQLSWFNREGKLLSNVGRPDRYVAVRISPDGARASAAIVDAQEKGDFWLVDLNRGLPSRITNTGSVAAAIWSPDGARLLFHTLNGAGLFAVPANGVGQESVLLQTHQPTYVSDTSPDGQFLVYTQGSSENGFDLWLLPTQAAIAGQRHF
jgi:Tol biopolymer transport system component